MPTQAQAIPTEIMDLAALAKASQMSFRDMRLMGRSSATTMVTRMVQKALAMTVLPLQISMYSRKMMGMSRWPRSFITWPTLGSWSLGMPCSWSFTARICTWMMMPR